MCGFPLEHEQRCPSGGPARHSEFLALHRLEDWNGIVEYNPLTSQVRSRTEDLDELRETVTELRLQLGWYDAFDLTAAAQPGHG
jgi:hypothetical protein